MPNPHLINKLHLVNVHEAIRVNHAGEYAAKIIYKNQVRKAQSEQLKQILTHMLHQEEKHFEFFEQQIKDRKIRPTVLLPLWGSLSKILGSFSSQEKYMMLVTKGIEEVIEKHYKDQISLLDKVQEKGLIDKIKQFLQEEIEHKDTAINKTYSLSWFDQFLIKTIKKGCTLAILLSKKI